MILRIIVTFEKRQWSIVFMYVFSQTVSIIFCLCLIFLFLIEETIDFLFQLLTIECKAMWFFKMGCMFRIILLERIHIKSLIIINFMSNIGLDLLTYRLKFSINFFLPFLFFIFQFKNLKLLINMWRIVAWNISGIRSNFQHPWDAFHFINSIRNKLIL